MKDKYKWKLCIKKTKKTTKLGKKFGNRTVS